MEQTTRVQRLRLHGQGLNASQAKQQVTRWLDKQTPARLGLPSDAIVLLRSVRAPWSALHPDSQADLLAPGLRGAVRPAMGTSPGPGCDAVWFADEAELLACLAQDSVQGQMGHRWWWQTWLGRRPSPEEALHAWLKSARSVPAAMARLKAMGHGLAWARHIGAAGRLALLHAMQGHHPVAQAANAWLTQSLSDTEIHLCPADSAADSADRAWVDASAGDASRRASTPARARVSPSQVDRDGASVLLTLCTLLQDSPHLALDAGQLTARLSRAPDAVDAGHEQSDRQDGAAGQSPGDAEQVHRQQDGPLHSARNAPHASRASTRGSTVGTPDGGRDRQAEPGQRKRAVPRDSMPVTDATAIAAAPDLPLPPSPLLTLGSVAPTQARPATRAPSAIHLGRSPSTQTEHGGAFFLLNVALAWELYGDFTRPRHALLSVSPWQFMHAAGIALMGHAFAIDPIAGWLRAQAPFARPRPATALAATPLALLPEAEARRLQSPEAHTPIDSTAPTPPLCARRAKDELSCWWPLLRRRLSLALSLPESEAIATCLRLPARIERRSERVDVVFALHQLPLAVRLAGLDRNPGWVPASGCDVRFHFEA